MVNEATHAALPGVTVGLTFVSGRRRTPLQRATTDVDGRFVLDVRASSAKEEVQGAGRYELSTSDRGVALVIKGGRWRWFAGSDPGEVQLCVHVPTACEPPVQNPPSVAGFTPDVVGRVFHHDGTPVPGVVVRVSHMGLGGLSAPLATDTTTSLTDLVPVEAGWYAVKFTEPAAPVPLNLVVHVLAPGAGGRLLATVPTRFGVSLPLRLDITLCDDAYRSPSEWARYETPLQEAIGEELPYHALDGTHIAFLAGSTKVPVDRVRWWVQARVLEALLGESPGLIGEAIYGLQYAGLPADLRVLHQRGQKRIEKGLAVAHRDNIIGKDAALLFESLMTELREWRAAQLLDDENPNSLWALFSSSGVLLTADPDQVTDLVELYKSYNGDRAAFWTAVASLSSFTPEAVTEAQRLVTLAAQAYSHPPTVKAITEAIANGVPSLTAGLTLEEWNDIVAEIPALPAGVDGDEEEDRRSNYAVQLRENAQAAYPGDALRARIVVDETFPSEVRNFAMTNTTFDFERDDVLARNDGGSDYLWDATDEGRAKTATFQRLHRIAPLSDRAAGALRMYNAGITSSRALARRGPTRAVEALTSTGMSAGDARLTVARAAQTSAKALTLFTQGHANLMGVKVSGNGTWPNGKGLYSRFLVAGDVDTTGVPSWEELFGNVDFCTCEDCKSITGPAAYLVDLLHWLDARGGWTDALATRRPDLGTVLLSCANTNRVLPYIDLALEALENAAATIMPSLDPVSVLSTEAEGAELLAAPQNVYHEVYANLATEVYPISLPFDQPLSEARVFLRHLGVERIALQRAFVVPVLGVTDPELDEEELGLFAGAISAITTAGDTVTGDVDEAYRWGLDDVADLCTVAILLRLAEISFEDLLDVVHTRYVNPDRALSVTSEDVCDLDAYEVVSTDTEDWKDAAFGRMRQLVRLRRATAWEFRDLDAVLTALGATTLTEEVVQKLGGIHALARRTGLSPVEVAVWFGTIDAWDDRDTADDPVPSLYERVFLNPSVFPIRDRSAATTRAFQFVLDASGEPNASLPVELDDASVGLYAAEVQALVGLDAASFAAILASPPASVRATRATLSEFYRWAALARAAGLSVVEALAFKALWGHDPFSSPAWASRFLDEARELQEAGLTVTDVRFLVEHEAKSVARLAPRDTWFDDVLGRLCTKLQEHFAAAVAPTSDPNHALLDTFLGSFGLSNFASVQAAIAGTSAEAADEFDGLAGYCDLTAFEEGLGRDAPLDPVDDADAIAARQLWAVQAFVEWRTDRTAEELVVTHFAEALGVPEAVLQTLRSGVFTSLTGLSDSPGPGTFTDWVEVWLHDHFRDSNASAAKPLDREDYPHEFELAGILVKVALIVSRLGLDADEVAFWAGAGLGEPWSFWSPYTIRAAAAAPSTTAYAGLKRLADLVRLRQRLPGTEPTLVSLLDEAESAWTPALDEDDEPIPPTDPDFAVYAALLAQRTGWDADQLAQIGDHIEIATPGVRSGAQVLLQQVEAYALVRRTGATAATVAGWVGDIGSDESAEVVLAARSRYDSATAWAKVARPLRDQLRKQQRDALVAYLVANSGTSVEDVDDLYGQLLIDTQMNPEMLTSRIKQAACSVQLYIQRNMVGIETAVEFNGDDRSEWEWMKNYRVWEAARKVFLYPENWIEPELRDVKTPFFTSLENELSQGDVTDARAEDVALTYLDRLHEVARPQVLAYYVQQETIAGDDGAEETIDLLHVFARSRGQSPTYWYRRWENQKTWTPWEKVECGVEGVHLVPVVYQRQLYLYWFVIDETGPSEAVEEGEPTSWYTVRLAWSTYRDGKWQSKNEAEDTLSLEHAWTGSNVETNGAYATRASVRAKTRFHFLSSETEDGTLEIRCICWHPGSLAWYDIGTFAVNPCTRAISAEEADTESLDGVFIGDLLGLTEIESTFQALVWATLTGAKRYEIMGALTPEEWEETAFEALAGSSLETFRSYLIGTYPNLYTSVASEGEPVRLNLLARVEGTFLAPGYQGATDDGGGEDLTIYLGDWSEDLQPTSGGETEVTLLRKLGESCVVLPTQFQDFVSQTPFFVEADNRTYFVVKEAATASDAVGVALGGLTVMDKVSGSAIASALDQIAEVGSSDNENLLGSAPSVASDAAASGGLYRFDNFFHPFVCNFIMEARREGIASLLDPSETGSAAALSRQQLHGEPEYFDSTFDPTYWVKTPYPQDDVDFDDAGAYALYNWELFFHLPFYVANRLADNQRFEDALRWYSFIFDPLNRPKLETPWETAPARFWKIKPFLEPVSAPVGDWIAFTGADGNSDAADAFERQVEEWRDDPFNPHLLARLRPGTYQKTIVMRYLENLIQWGDQLFARDTIETINEATQLYVLAKQVLGDRPEKLKRTTSPVEKSFNDLLGEGLDAFSESVVTSPVVWLEGLLRPGRWEPFSASRVGSFRLGSAEPAPSVGGDTYFCIPPNPKLLGYWDTVDDRLFKIRNSLNLEGVFRTLPLYEPPIDPALLVRASALGVDIGSVLSELSTPLPGHRFSAMLPRAQGLAGSVKALGGALLSALEKRDAEALSLLRSSHETTLLGMVRQSKEKAIDEAMENLAGARASRKTAEARRDYYAGLISKGWSGEEVQAAQLQLDASGYETMSGVIQSIGSILGAIPDLLAPLAVETGGDQFSRVVSGIAGAYGSLASYTRGQAGYLGTVASYKRRAEDWGNQKKLAEREITQIDRQIAAGEIRVALSKHELTVHETQAKQADEVRSWMESKFTNEQLYDWMVSQLSATYYQSYQLAYRAAKRAEACYRYELGREDAYVTSAYWDNTRKGLLAGELLGYDLERLDAAYLENNRREFELTKHVSLSQLDPTALLALQETGECLFSIPETEFDLDFPGHYFRRIQSVSVTLAATAGRHGTINAELELSTSQVRKTPDAAGLVSDQATVETIALSGAIDDAGLFRADFSDPRYLPFERRGVISNWSLRLTGRPRQFDWATLTDVILHVRYTARNGGQAFRTVVEATLPEALNVEDTVAGPPEGANATGLYVGVSAARDFPDAWHQFLHPSGTGEGQTIMLNLDTSLLCHALGISSPAVDKLWVYLLPADRSLSADFGSLPMVGALGEAPLGTGAVADGAITYVEASPWLPVAVLNPQADSSPTTAPIGSLVLTMTPSTEEPLPTLPALLQGDGSPENPLRLKPSAFSDLVVILRYGVL